MSSRPDAVVRGPGGPLAGLAGFAACLAVVGSRSPEQPGHYPVCPFHALTGLWCPGCGSLRAMHALAHGDLTTAAHRNVLLVTALPLLAYGWLRWLRNSIRRHIPAGVPSPVFSSLLSIGVVFGFGVLRNLPWFGFLAP
jgi:hypothetical protein